MKEKCSLCEGTGRLFYDGHNFQCDVCDGKGWYVCDCGYPNGFTKTCENCDTFDCCDPDPVPPDINEPDIEATRE